MSGPEGRGERILAIRRVLDLLDSADLTLPEAKVLRVELLRLLEWVGPFHEEPARAGVREDAPSGP
jgi:hypothetical protein